ncbi:glycosyl transferase [Thalassospira profundimaris]|uniref:Glycosyl transferase n=1 Tax=Thalassospira profundimaris TaxID=502049 RepID=A0A367XF13_9PROT|nr:glycosyltransferase family 4 protein [Thalassospira profundimaris]RCK51242.1 glycosyl transferase [Thalassospira profundimaris]
MRIAFYAPLKPLDHPVPSGDRLMARLLVTALKRAGHDVDIAARLRSRVADGNSLRQMQLAELGGKLARRLLRRYETGFLPRPDIWFTYHLYYKAPDWIGPLVAAELGIPYILCEASHAPKRATGPWAASHRAVEQALQQARAVLCPNRADMACLAPITGAQKLHFLPPFTDIGAWQRAGERPALQQDATTSSDPVELITVAMMRPGDKFQSFVLLAEALGALPADVAQNWRLTIVGDGPARDDVAGLFARFDAGRVVFVGQCDATTTRDHLARADLCVWPAINEAYGMALLEAQAAGLPVVAGDYGGVGGIVRNGETGWLVPAGDPAAFARQLAYCLANRAVLKSIGQRAAQNALAHHDISSAARVLDHVIADVLDQQDIP